MSELSASRSGVANTTPMTEQELAALPTVNSLETTARAIGIGRDTAYKMARAGDFPVRFLPGHGNRRCCSKADILSYLGYEPTVRAAG